ncbi:type VII secretion-associated protein [Mycobacterium hodleri]|uniref:Type VII secretion-associated protein n=1 Tax=Mycolicibacterium hodleri TaxID=49897 RepID=A0A544VRX2_9MYCO|nr:type VII secretion-associated protein [Mycolicibacterium hodleri]TQR82705.1 type VII secretion-associated protein [Mycolicibacterium hodleri]
MSDVVVVVGPKAIVGRGPVNFDAATIALESVDDVLALVDDRVMSVDDLWRDVLGSAVDGRCDDVALICPSWWGPSRIARVVAAARHWCDDVVVHLRSEVLAAVTVVELGPELVVVHADGRRNVITRGSHSADVVDAVVACVDGLAEVTVDVPSGTTLLGANLARALRLRGVAVTMEDDRTLADAVRGSPGSETVTAGRWRPTPRTVGVAAAILTVGGLTLAGIGLDGGNAESTDVAWLVEGRVAVEVPAGWTVERITAGPGSARVQVVSPAGRSEAIQVTQSRVSDTESLESTAEALTSALADQPGGVFVDFAAAGERANRSAVTYREVRSDRSVDWTVLLDGGVRIAIGCQGPVAGSGPQAACDRAIRTAHAVTRK